MTATHIVTDFGTALTDDDYQRLAERAITSEMADANGLRRVDSETGREMFGRKRGNLAGIIIPNVAPWNPGHPREYRLRLDEPELEYQSDGGTREKNKYIQPSGRGNTLYFPVGIPAAALVDTSITVLITEGEFKAIAAMGLALHNAHALRCVPIAMTGAWNFYGVVGKNNNSKGARIDIKGVIPDFDHVTWKGRRVILAYDADVETNPSVRAARWKLTSVLLERGAIVGNLEWPIEEAKGLDDYLFKVGTDRVLADIEAVKFGDWRLRLLRNDAGKLIPCHDNAALFLENSPEWAGVLGYNEFTAGHMILKQPPAPITATAGDELADAFDTESTRWFERKGIMIKPAVVRNVLDCFARRNTYHPVRDYLNSLPPWDNTSRIATWLANYCGVESSEYALAVGEMFLISAVARVVKPGCKVDHTLVLEADQGILKSTAVRTLAGDEFFTDQIRDFGSKDASMQVRGAWIIELAELAPLINQRTDMERVKQFLTQQDDRFRAPYGHRVVRTPRQCVFIGTTNADEWMKDETGNRRFWPVRCRQINIEALKRDRDQLWAEALQRYKDGAHWWLEDKKLIRAATEEQRDRFVQDPWHEKVLQHAKEEAGLPVSEPRGSVSVSEILLRLNLPIEKHDQAAANRVARILKVERWKRHNEGPRGEREWRYRPPKWEGTDAVFQS